VPASKWISIAPSHGWADKPRWAPNGRALYFITKAGSPYFNLWGVRFDPDRGTAIGDPVPVTRFDSRGCGSRRISSDGNRHFGAARGAGHGKRPWQHLVMENVDP
jgi:hypothetical protein